MSERPAGKPSSEALAAIEQARDAKAGINAVLPLTERMRDELRAATAANHFADLFRSALSRTT